eukprot:sb/3464355/
MSSAVKYSRLDTTEPFHRSTTTPSTSITPSGVLGAISCLLFTGCIFLSIAIARLLAENHFLQSQYMNYTSSYSFGVVSDLYLDTTPHQTCCEFETNFSCLCCPTNPALLNATFQSLVAVLRMYVNTKFILYLGNIAHHQNQTVQTYAYFRDFIKQSEVSIPVFPTLGAHDRPTTEVSTLFYSEIFASWSELIGCFGCPLAPPSNGVKETFVKGGYYSITSTYGVRIISLNTNLFLDDATVAEKAQGHEQINWLEDVLDNSRTIIKGKIMIGGTAPGHSNILVPRKNSPTSSQKWDENLQLKFTTLISKHQYRWAAIMFGGAEFELVRALDRQYMFLSPPCSPLLCSQPAFRVAFLSERDLELLDLHQYYSPTEFFTRVGKAPKFMFDYSYERVIFGSEQPRGPVYLNTFSIRQMYESLVTDSFDLGRWEALVDTKKIDKVGVHTSPLITFCLAKYSNVTLQRDCLGKFKYSLK